MPVLYNNNNNNIGQPTSHRIYQCMNHHAPNLYHTLEYFDFFPM